MVTVFEKLFFFFHAEICMTNIFMFYIFFSNLFVCCEYISLEFFPHMETPPNNNEDMMCL